MKTKMKDNEQKIIDAINNLKDSVFGLHSSYAQFCYSTIDGKWTLDKTKINDFVNGLLIYARQHQKYSDTYENLMTNFFELVVVYIDCVCPIDDQLFVSFRKILNTIKKDSVDSLSTFDVMINDEINSFDKDFIAKYEYLTKTIVEADYDSFCSCVKYAINEFVDNNQLNILSDDIATERAIININRLSSKLKFDFQRKNF